MNEAVQLRQIAASLISSAGRLPEFQARRRQWTRGGFGSSSIPEAPVHGGDPVLPWSDAVDQALYRDFQRIGQIAEASKKLSDELSRLLNRWLIAAPALPELSVVCANPACGQLVEEGRKSGECQRCRQWRRRHNAPYPYESVSA